MLCHPQLLSHFLAWLLCSVLVTACGKEGDNVTETPNRTNPRAVPHAGILLTQLPEIRQTVYFEKDSYELKSDDQRRLDPIAVRLRQHPDSYVIVIGHSDDSGSEEENIVLSYERAFSVAIYIASVFGVEEERIQLVAAGDSDPVTGGESEKEKQQNRRVEVWSPQMIVRTLSPTSEPAF